MNAYLAYLFGGMLRRMACHVRPFEAEAGATDRAVGEGLALFERVILGESGREDAVVQVVELFLSIPREQGKRIKVAVFGDLYTRDNDVMNQGLERFVEAHGGEVISTPYSQHARMVAEAYMKRWFSEWKFGRLLWNKALLATMSTFERGLYRHFEKVTGEPYEVYEDPPAEILSDYRVFTDHSGESMENLLWAHYTRKRHPDLALFVQASPAFCCPAMVTEAMRKRIEHHTGVPVVSITYDGTGGNKNEILVPYLKFPRVRESG